MHKFEKLYQENPESPAYALMSHFDGRQELNAYADYRMARRRGLSHVEAMEKLAKLQPDRQREAEFFAERNRRRQDEDERSGLTARARSLRETATGGPTSV